MSGEFRFKWVGEDETTFDPELHWVEAEQIEEFALAHDEDKACQLDIVVKNPGAGLLNPYRDRFAWFSWHNGTEHEALFFGEVMSLPSDLAGLRVTLTLMAKSHDYEEQLQRLTDILKVLPGYDPIFLDVAFRDDPQAVLEGYPVVRHIDRLTHLVSLSDIIVGEGELIVFEEDDVLPWNSLKMAIKESPAHQIEMHADVKWTQRATGVVDLGGWTFRTYSGDGIVGDWPKPLASLGGGWSVENSSVLDHHKTGETIVASYSFNWQNKAREHANGDTMSVSISVSDPQIVGPQLQAIMTEQSNVGLFDPFADPQVNIPARIQRTTMHVPEWKVSTTLSLRYEADNRERSETVKFTLKADLQRLLGEPSTIVVKKSGSDVGQPLVTAEDRDGMSGDIAVGTIMLLDGVYYVATQGGVLSDPPPEEFDEVLGATTVDGTVIWTSLGEQMFTEMPDWVKDDFTPLGQIIHPEYPRPTHYTMLLPPSPAPLVGVSIAEGTVVRTTNGSFQQCTDDGVTGLVEPNFPTVRDTVTMDGTVEWTCLGTELPVGRAGYQLAIQEGTTGALIPLFNTVGNNTNDGTVIWKNISNSPSFIAAPIIDPSRRSYFPGDRGLESLKYLIGLARNQLLMKARCLHITFNCHFNRISVLSLIKNAKVYSPLIPGGVAVGKIVNYKARCAGPRHSAACEVTIAVAIGNGGAPSPVLGEPEVWEEDVVETDVQYHVGAVDILTSGDIGFTPPRDAPQDDGLVFPLTAEQVIVAIATHGSLAEQESAIYAAFLNESQIANLPPASSAQQAVDNAKKLAELNKKNMDEAFKENPIWQEIKLKPVAGNGPFDLLYKISMTDLHVNKGIDLAAE